MENIEVNTADLIGPVPVMEELAPLETFARQVHTTRLTSRRERYRAVYEHFMKRPQTGALISSGYPLKTG